jgi:hypothetical protein
MTGYIQLVLSTSVIETHDFVQLFAMKSKTSVTVNCLNTVTAFKRKMTLTKHNSTANLTAPQHEVGFCGSFFSKGDNTPIIKSVFLCLPFLAQSNFGLCKFIMTALFGQPLRLVVPLHDTANSNNAVTRFFAVSSDGFTTLSKGIAA